MPSHPTTMEKVAYLGKELTRWQVGNSTFLAMPELGARLMHWHLTLGDGSVRDILYWPELTSLEGFATTRGGKIFSWLGTDGVERPIPIHGIARQGVFKTTRCDARGFAAQFVPGDEAKASYPYDYEFTVTYLFEPLGLSCEFTLKNLGTQPIPWSAGHHFYFTLPWNEGLKRGDYSIRIPAGKTLKQDQTNGKLSAGPVFQPEESLANKALVDVFHTNLKSPGRSTTKRRSTASSPGWARPIPPNTNSVCTGCRPARRRISSSRCRSNNASAISPTTTSLCPSPLTTPFWPSSMWAAWRCS